MAYHQDNKPKWEAPPGGLLIQAYRQEAAQFERDGKLNHANRLRKAADKMQMLSEMIQKGKIVVSK